MLISAGVADEVQRQAGLAVVSLAGTQCWGGREGGKSQPVPAAAVGGWNTGGERIGEFRKK